MVKTIRHTFFLLTALCLTAACEKQEPKSQQQSSAMEFDVAGITRAASTTAQNITDYPFAVYGDMTFIDTQSRTEIFNGLPVTYNSSDNKWTYPGTPQYWFPKHEHSFVALYPHPDSDNTSCLSDIQYTSDSELKFKYTYPFHNYKDATDVLVAVHRREYTEGDATPVRFTFAHILSNIRIQASYYNPDNKAVPLEINSISFENIPVSASYNIAPAVLAGNHETGDYDKDMTQFEGVTVIDRSDMKIEFEGDEVRILPPDGKPLQLFSDSDALLLIPNSEANTQMTVSYVTYKDGERKDNSETVVIPISWKPGYTYTLSLSYSLDKLQFSIIVEEWNREDGDSTSIDVPRKISK